MGKELKNKVVYYVDVLDDNDALVEYALFAVEVDAEKYEAKQERKGFRAYHGEITIE